MDALIQELRDLLAGKIVMKVTPDIGIGNFTIRFVRETK